MVAVLRNTCMGLGILSAVLSMALGTCGGPGASVALAEDALELVEDGEPLDGEPLDAQESEPETADDVATEQGTEDDVLEDSGETEPDAGDTPGAGDELSDGEDAEPVVDSEGPTLADVMGLLEVIADDVSATSEHVAELETKPLIDLQMMATGALGALLGSVAFAGLWRVLGGGR